MVDVIKYNPDILKKPTMLENAIYNRLEEAFNAGVASMNKTVYTVTPPQALSFPILKS